MKSDVAAVVDCGDKFKVKYVSTQQNAYLKNDEVYIKISNVAADIIKAALSEYKTVHLPKNVSGELCFSDIIIGETDELSTNKLIFLSNLYNKVDYKLFNVSAIDFYDYMSAFNVLASKGYFISDDNREEKYIEIIETDNDVLIEYLEVYLEKKDKLDAISYVYGKTRKYEKLVNECTTQDNLNKIQEDFDAENV